MTAPPRVFLLKSPDFSTWQRDVGVGLPYRVDLLGLQGVKVSYSDVLHRRPWRWQIVRSVAQSLEARTTPFLQTLLSVPQLARADVALGIFESEAHFLALLRALHVWPKRHPQLAIISCWVAQLLPTMSARKVHLYQWLYRSVDRVYFFSANQRETLRDGLGVDESRLQLLDFGIDETYFAPSPGESDERTLLVVGRDRGRDWPTLFKAVNGLSDVRVRVLARPRDLAGLEVPENVEVVGYVDRATYRAELHAATAVAVPTHVLAYPTGQSVFLEALAAEKACVITMTPAIEAYVQPDVTALTVPPSDSSALRAAVIRLLDDPQLRRRLGTQGRADVLRRFTARQMWEAVANDVRKLTGRRE